MRQPTQFEHIAAQREADRLLAEKRAREAARGPVNGRTDELVDYLGSADSIRQKGNEAAMFGALSADEDPMASQYNMSSSQSAGVRGALAQSGGNRLQAMRANSGSQLSALDSGASSMQSEMAQRRSMYDDALRGRMGIEGRLQQQEANRRLRDADEDLAAKRATLAEVGDPTEVQQALSAIKGGAEGVGGVFANAGAGGGAVSDERKKRRTMLSALGGK